MKPRLVKWVQVHTTMVFASKPAGSLRIRLKWSLLKNECVGSDYGEDVNNGT